MTEKQVSPSENRKQAYGRNNDITKNSNCKPPSRLWSPASPSSALMEACPLKILQNDSPVARRISCHCTFMKTTNTWRFVRFICILSTFLKWCSVWEDVVIRRCMEWCRQLFETSKQQTWLLFSKSTLCFHLLFSNQIWVFFRELSLFLGVKKSVVSYQDIADSLAVIVVPKPGFISQKMIFSPDNQGVSAL